MYAIKLQVIYKLNPPLHVSAINRHPEGDVNTKEFILLRNQSQMHRLKNI